jgi:hypothetical protein
MKTEHTLYKYPSIEQFKTVVKNVKDRTHWIGKDENGEPIFDRTKVPPKIKFHGNIKLHGTNHSVCITLDENGDKTLYTQSKERISTPENDNAGSSIWSHSNKEHFIKGVEEIFNDKNVETVVVYGEFCGGSIQAKVALNQLPKMFVIFGIKTIDKEGNHKWFKRKEMVEIAEKLIDDKKRIFHIEQFPTFEIVVDFDNPHEIQNELVRLTEEVEKECPVGKYFGVSGIGEGIVWNADEEIPNMQTTDLIFKTKGDAHAGGRTKVVVPADVEKINNIKELVKKLTPEWRLEQAHATVFDTLNGGTGDIKRMGELMKWVVSDIVKEEIDTITESGFVVKDLTGEISKVVRNWFLAKLDE